MLATSKLVNKTLNSVHVRVKGNAVSSNYSTKSICNFKSVRAKKYAPDGNGTQKTQVNWICEKDNCEKQHCKNLCDEVKEAEITGNYTHSSQIKGKNNVQVVKVKNTDIEGNPRPQFFAKVPKRIKFTKDDLKDLTESDLSIDKKGTAFCNTDPNILKEIS